MDRNVKKNRNCPFSANGSAPVYNLSKQFVGTGFS